MLSMVLAGCGSYVLHMWCLCNHANAAEATSFQRSTSVLAQQMHLVYQDKPNLRSST